MVTTQVARCPKFAARRHEAGPDGPGRRRARAAGPSVGPALTHHAWCSRGAGESRRNGTLVPKQGGTLYQNEASNLTRRTPVTDASEVTPTTAVGGFQSA